MTKEERREYAKKYREKHKDKIREYQKKYWIEHGEEINAKRRNRKCYKARCKRAIEYIEEHIKHECDDAFNGMEFYSYHLCDFDKKELLEILDKGEI